ncbi:MAG: NAD+ synthase [Halobacteriales archaeon]
MPDLRLDDGELEERIETITSFIAERCEAAGVNGVVLGLSGGVDSATTTGLAARALGPDRVRPLALPAAPTAPESLEYAGAVADAFGLELETIDVEPVVEEVRSIHPRGVDRKPLGNVRARVRAVYWYLVANQEGRLVLGGGNRTEWLVGYFTKYGDIAVDILPLGNLYKTQVRQVARHIGVPEAVLERAPTAELWEDQTDEGELGIAYDTLDGILSLRVDEELGVAETAEALHVDETLVERVDSLRTASTHKRRPPATPP